MAGPGRFDAIAAALRQPNFAWYLWGGAPSLVGMWVHRVAVLWLTWELTHSGTWLGLMSFADLAPTVVVTPVAGAIADRVDRRRMAILTQSIALLQALVLAGLVMTGLIDIWSLWVLSLLLGITLAFYTAARLSMVPNLMLRENVPSAIAMDSAVFNIARFLGPMIAGAIIAGWGVGPAFLFNAASYLIFLFALWRLRMLTSEVSGRGAGGMVQQSLDGMRYAWRHPGIRPMLLLLCALAVGSKAFLDLLPGFADDVFHRGAVGLAQLTAAAGLGAFTAAFYLAQRGSAQGLTLVTISSLGIAGFGVLVLCATDTYWIGLIGVYFAGVSITLGGTGTQTLMQNVVDGAMRGRVMSFYGVIYRGGPALGALVLGIASDFVGMQAAVGSGALVTLAAWLWMLRRRHDTAAALEAVRA